ncbi:patatin-like phospholipase domain-containing protein 2 [Nylanderia fulva]|uniref:patatin-like phospholipase domain-containing protein 2 n=1 Tax=Nylanderia fulva TaxID=613905 RepID=UPI0010FB9014|nr:patatin-like phospholipase domain-containing protein 2 [Nylanderia fulva]
MILEFLQKLLPDDAHIRVNGKLHISLTRVYDMKNVIISQFDSREDLIQALLATSFVPIFSGYLPPKYRDIRYMDGALSNNLFLFDEDTITISPFCGENDICPRDFSAHLFDIFVSNMSVELSQKNIHRLIQAFLPPKIEILLDMCQQGHDDALQFLHCRNLLKLNRIHIHNKYEFILLIDYGINTTQNNNDKILKRYISDTPRAPTMIAQQIANEDLPHRISD